jgi:ribonuclease VapC
VIAVDASAVLAILLGESEEARFRSLLRGAGGVISSVNFWEVLARVHREEGPEGAWRAEDLMHRLGIDVATAGRDEARLAYEAFARFGKGCGGPLNLGDCFAYALAEIEGDGLLFKGDDFPVTDVRSALT